MKKVTMYELLGMVKDRTAPKKILINDEVYYLLVDEEHYVYSQSKDIGQWDFFIDRKINIQQNLDLEVLILDENYKVEIIEEENKFTKEDFIKEAMDLEGLTREEFNKIYEVKECNCGREFCKGFIKVEKVEEEKKIPEKLNWKEKESMAGNLTKDEQIEVIARRTEHLKKSINEILNYLEEIK